MKLEDYIASIENYPKEGVTFRDISPLMADGNAYSYACLLYTSSTVKNSSLLLMVNRLKVTLQQMRMAVVHTTMELLVIS